MLSRALMIQCLRQREHISFHKQSDALFSVTFALLAKCYSFSRLKKKISSLLLPNGTQKVYKFYDFSNTKLLMFSCDCLCCAERKVFFAVYYSINKLVRATIFSEESVYFYQIYQAIIPSNFQNKLNKLWETISTTNTFQYLTYVYHTLELPFLI